MMMMTGELERARVEAVECLAMQTTRGSHHHLLTVVLVAVLVVVVLVTMAASMAKSVPGAAAAAAEAPGDVVSAESLVAEAVEISRTSTTRGATATEVHWKAVAE